MVVGDDGYLTSIEYASEDATPRIAVALAELVAKSRTGPAAVPAVAKSLVAPLEPFKVLFDPFDERDVGRAGDDISKVLPGYKIDLPDVRALAALRARRQTCDGKGVCFRTRITTPVRVLKGGNVIAIASLQVSSPHVGNLDLDRAFLVEKVARLGFSDGALTEVAIKRPSQALQAAKLPLDILDVLLAVPVNFVNNLTGTAQEQKILAADVKSRAEIMKSISDNMKLIAQGTVTTPAAEASTAFKLMCKGTVLNPNPS